MRQKYNTRALTQEDRKEPQRKDPEEERQRNTGRLVDEYTQRKRRRIKEGEK